MENEAIIPEEGQDAPSVEFDEAGELKFTEQGLEGFKELLKEGVQDNARPTAEPEPEDEPEPEPPPVTPTKRLKVGGEEFDVTEADLIALAQQGADYTRKTQQLAEERNALAPYEALITQLRRDPNLSQHIAKYWSPPEQKSEEKQFDDPIEQLKYETKQEAIAEMRKEMQQALRGAVTPLHRQAALNQVKQQVQADPDYPVVHNSIVEMVKGMPPSIQKNMFLQLDQDPKSYMETYLAHKERMAANIRNLQNETRRTERAPILESSNNAPTETEVKSQRVRIDKAKARAMRDGSVESLQGFLEAGGFLDHLT